jgi:hypothetical protein
MASDDFPHPQMASDDLPHPLIASDDLPHQVPERGPSRVCLLAR